MSQLRLDIQLKNGSAQNQLIATDSGGKLQFISAPTADGQALVRASGVLAWQTISGTSYIGDAANHTAGGNLNMGGFAISNSSSITGTQLIVADNASGDLVPWILSENSSNQLEISNNSTAWLKIATSTGALSLEGYGGGSLTGTLAYYLGVDAAGNVIESASAGGGSNTIYAGDDVLTANRIVHLTDSIATPVAKRTLTLKGLNNDIVFDDGVISPTGITFNAASADNMSIAEEEATGTTRLRFKKASTNLVSIEESGRMQFHNYTGTTFSGTVSKILTIDSTGIMLTTQPEINILADVDASTPNDGDFLIYNNSTSNWEATAFPNITFAPAGGTSATAGPGDTVTFSTVTSVAGSFWNIYFAQETIIDWATTVTTGVKTGGVIVIPSSLGAYDVYGYGITTNATASGQQVQTVLLKNGAATSGSSALSTPISGAAGRLTNAVALGTPETVSGGDVLQVQVTGVTGNPEGLAVFLELRR